MKNLNWFLLFALLFSCSTSASAADKAEKSGQSEKTIYLEQTSDAYGKVVTAVSRHALKISLCGSKAYLVACAPIWRVTLCDSESKKMLSMSLFEWLHHVPKTSYLGSDWERFDFSISPRQITHKNGLDYAHFVFPPDKPTAVSLKLSAKYHGDYEVISGFGAAPEACAIMQKALNCPEVKGDKIPVNLVNRGKTVAVVGMSRILGGDEHWCTRLVAQLRPLSCNYCAFGQDLATAV